ncbi:FtsX-like permease family protein [Catenuloplanes atrovinosus]|uniref:ABC transport system permease protein n=1 Tax=Catenuloplanes atrovinosus TaxID=137266 RepID=A0AAE3YKP2_9ACTN|nr:FtsX-like permease family protein [Catenuloplanes atrovinosus]MDR7274179.1 putative ABC transport system permease protein [Catenuloplanes atrovinosus]
MRSWLTALRISRREMRRAKGRSAMVVAMIAVPVAALGYAAASYDMYVLTPEETATRQLGAADALLLPRLTEPIVQGPDGDMWMPASTTDSESHQGRASMTEAEALDVLPMGSRVVSMGSSGDQFRTAAGGLANAPFVELDLADPIFRGMVELVDGRAPAGPGEVAMSEAARERFGDTIQNRERDRTWTVVGTVEFPAELGELMLFPPGTHALEQGGSPSVWLADTPEPVDWAQVNQINRRGIAVTSRAVLLDPPDPSTTAVTFDDTPPSRTFALLPVVSGLAMLEIILLAGPAFAVGARRRQRSLALVAANGGTRAHLRRIVLADGLTLGLAGAAIGLVLAVILAVVGRPFVEDLVDARFGAYRFSPTSLAGIVVLAVVTGVLAAAVPAFTAARADVVAALTGRRGVVRSKRRWLIAGLVLAAAGGAIAATGPQDAANWGAERIVAGLVIAQLGLVLCTPSLVGLIARLGGALPPAPRIALRDAARNRAAAAPAVSAVMAAVAGTVAIGVYLVSTEAKDNAGYRPGVPDGYVTVQYDTYRDDYDPASEGLARAAVTAALPGATATEISEVTCPDGSGYESCAIELMVAPAHRCPGEENEPTTREEIETLARDPRCERIWRHTGVTFRSAVGGRDALVALTGASGADLDRAAAMLDRGGVVVGDPSHIDNGMVSVQRLRMLPGADESESEDITVPGYLLESGPFGAGVVLSPAAVERAGLAHAPAGLVVATAPAPAVSDLDRLNSALAEAGSGSAHVESGPADDGDPVALMLAAASGLITLGAAGMATGLAAADGRADLSTLAAIGAAPRVRRLLSLSQSGVIAGLGSVLGILAGIGSAFAVLAARNATISGTWPLEALYPLAVPWAHLGLILVVPLVAMLGAGLLTRSRLPIERRRPT